MNIEESETFRVATLTMASIRKLWPEAKGHIAMVDGKWFAVYVYIGDSKDLEDEVDKLSHLVEKMLRLEGVIFYAKFLQRDFRNHFVADKCLRGGRVGYCTFWLPTNLREITTSSFCI